MVPTALKRAIAPGRRRLKTSHDNDSSYSQPQCAHYTLRVLTAAQSFERTPDCTSPEKCEHETASSWRCSAIRGHSSSKRSSQPRFSISAARAPGGSEIRRLPHSYIGAFRQVSGQGQLLTASPRFEVRSDSASNGALTTVGATRSSPAVELPARRAAIRLIWPRTGRRPPRAAGAAARFGSVVHPWTGRRGRARAAAPAR